MAITLKQRVGELEKMVLKLAKSNGERNKEMRSLKEGIVGAINLLDKNKKYEAIQLLKHECRPLWRSPASQKRWDKLHAETSTTT